MSFRGVGIALVIVLATGFASTASAENGMPSQAAMKQMGLGGLKVMSDAEGMKVRGQGAFAGGLSLAYIGPAVPFPPAASINVSAATGTYYAAAANSSYADQLVVNGTVVVAPPAITGSATFSYTRFSAGGASWARSF